MYRFDQQKRQSGSLRTRNRQVIGNSQREESHINIRNEKVNVL